DVVTQRLHLAGAHTGEGEREEHDDNRPPAQRRQAHRGTVLVGQLEVGSLRPDTDHRRLDPFGATSLVPDHSSVTETVVVVDRPAVNAASAMSLASTCPSRPTLGVSSHTTPPAARSVLASTRASARSPSS